MNPKPIPHTTIPEIEHGPLFYFMCADKVWAMVRTPQFAIDWDVDCVCEQTVDEDCCDAVHCDDM